MTLGLEEIKKSILLTKLKILIWKKMPARYSVSEMRGELGEFYSDLFQRLSSFFKALRPFLKEARSDENVLIYLIEKKDLFNKHLGERHIEALLQSFFPAGHDQLRAAIHEGYTRRGFDTFLTSVEPLIDTIQWEMPCSSQITQEL